MLRRWTGLVILACATASLGSAAHASDSAKAKTIRVTVRDAGFTLSASSAPVGSVVFVVTNKGKAKHNFRINGKRTPVLAAGKSARLTVVFRKAARYAYVSTLSGQAKKGLKGTLRVVAAPKPKAPAANVKAGKQVFLTNGCGACHTLKSAGTTGTVGPNLDKARLSTALIVSRVTNGKKTMPSFKQTLTAAQIRDVAAFIYAAEH